MSSENLGATELLRTIRHQSEACRFTNQAIEVAVLQSLALEKQGRAEEALKVLEETVALAGPGGWIRPFVEAGPPMADLLKRLQKQNGAVDYIEKLLAAFRDDEQVVVSEVSENRIASASPLSPRPLVEPLTNRELDILELLEQRPQTKEVAKKMFISPETVKSHLKNIFQKLEVSNRRQAVDKAKNLGIL